MIDNTIIVALISLIGTLGGSLGGILVSSKLTARQKKKGKKLSHAHRLSDRSLHKKGGKNT